jgi:hypothetical protein
MKHSISEYDVKQYALIVYQKLFNIPQELVTKI